MLVDNPNAACPDNLDQHTWKKLRNIYSTIVHVTNPDVDATINLDFVKSIHSKLGHEVFENGGQFRTHRVCARSSSVIYAMPKTIEERLVSLLAFVNEYKLLAPNGDGSDRLLYMIRLGAIFFSEFLLVHPFGNANGRTARILLNAFLREDVAIPFSLYVKSRATYIEALEARNNLSPPSQLATYILNACNKTAAQVNWLLMK